MAETLIVTPPEHSPAADGPSAPSFEPAPRKVAAPEPNPNFSFPMMPLDPASQKLGDLLSSPGRPGSRHRPANITVDNSTSPWGLLPPSPSKAGSTPDSTHSSPTRGGGALGRSAHKRAGSEFIGGDSSTSGPGLMSTSPTKGEGSLASIPTSGRRRGHAHRRSGAISHHDLSVILKPSTHDPLPTRPGSLPSTPSMPNHPHPLPHATSQPSLHTSQGDETPPATPKGTEMPTHSPPPSRPRVGFSDTVEFIPRPLSTISSETSSSMSTIRASHSVTGSITSIISNGTPSPSSARKSQYTADILERYRQDAAPSGGESPTPHVSKRRGSPPPRSRMDEPQSMDDAPATVPNSMNPSSIRQPPALLQGFEVAKPQKPEDPLPSPPFTSSTTIMREFSRSAHPVQLERPRSSPEAKVSKKQKKVKVWAESILSRRGKGKFPEELSTPTLSRDNFATMDDLSLDAVNFDDDNTCVIKSPDYAPPKSAGSTTASSTSYEDEEDETEPAGGVLDLDATWEELDENDKSFAAAKKRMHSGGATGTFTGPGMHYHRRAESAPTLAPMEGSSALRRPGSNSHMADVFEEVEEEDDEDEEDDDEEDGSIGLPQATPDSEPSLRFSADSRSDGDEESIAASVKGRSQAAENLPAIISDVESASQPSEVQTPRDVPELSDVEIVDTVDEPRFSVVTKSSDESTITPTLNTPSPFSEVVSPLGAARVDVASPPATTSPAAPCLSEAHIAFDARPLKTAASSLTDRSFTDRSTWSRADGADAVVGPASFTYSTEDVPSLTSSASTTFSAYHGAGIGAGPLSAPQSSGSAPFDDGVLEPPATANAERSQSFSGISARRFPRPGSASAIKRSSLASLSRLVGASSAARSKLSLEVYSTASALDDDGDGGTETEKKRKRISRLMKFWRPRAEKIAPK